MPARNAFLIAFALFACQRKSEVEPLPSASNAPAVSAAPVASAVEAGAEPDASVTPPRQYNVLLILIDSLRADAVKRSERHVDMPRLVELSEKSIVYENAYAISSTTARSVAPLLVGRYPSEMERNGMFFTRWYPSNDFVGEHLQKLGVSTLAVGTHSYFYQSSGLNQGFDRYELLPGTVANPKPGVTSERLTKLARGMLQRATSGHADARFFAYFHYLDPHAPYLDHESSDAGPEAPSDAGDPVDPRVFYRQEVRYTDEWVGVLLDWVKQQKWAANTAIIVSADHGEAFGEHKQQKHGYELWEELVRVPMVIHVPGAEHRVIQTPRSHIDLAPTILDLMGAPPDPKHRGKSLRPELSGGAPEPRPVVLDLPRDNLQDRRRAVIDGREKIIARGDDERWLFYDLENDPKERKNLSETERARFERMKKLYLRISAEIPVEEVHGDTKLKNAPEGQRF
jgi:choline-sulfatase